MTDLDNQVTKILIAAEAERIEAACREFLRTHRGYGPKDLILVYKDNKFVGIEVQMTRAKQLAYAYIRVAHADHYMVGITEAVTEEELLGAEQFLITWENELDRRLPSSDEALITAEDEAHHDDLKTALDLVEAEKRKRRLG